jgi:arylsulfatase
MGCDKYREIVFECQKKMGIMLGNSDLTPANPYANEKSVGGKPWNPMDVTRP